MIFGDENGLVRVTFSPVALQAFIVMLNNANINVNGMYLHFMIEEYRPGEAQLLVAENNNPNEEVPFGIDPVITSIEEEV